MPEAKNNLVKNNLSTKKRVAIFDFDGTLVESHLWGAFLKENFKRKERIFLSIWHIFYHMFFYYLSKFHLYSYEKCLKDWTEDIPKLFKGLRKKDSYVFFKKIWDDYLKKTLKKKVLNRLKWHQRRGDITILASNAPEDFLEIVKEELKFDFVVGTKIGVKNGKYTGKVIFPIPWRSEKLNQVKNLLKEKNINVDYKNSFAYSDSERDIEVLKAVGNSVVVDPDEKLLKFAKKRKWEIL